MLSVMELQCRALSTRAHVQCALVQAPHTTPLPFFI